jgi:hypothetical protein
MQPPSATLRFSRLASAGPDAGRQQAAAPGADQRGRDVPQRRAQVKRDIADGIAWHVRHHRLGRLLRQRLAATGFNRL